jgi:hypothetical protein
MTEERRNEDRPSAEEDLVAAVYRLAGPPPVLPEEEVEPIRAAARQVFQQRVRRRSRRRVAWMAASLAACLALFLSIPALHQEPEVTSNPPLATVSRRQGAVIIDPGIVDLGSPGRLGRGASIATGPTGRVSLALAEEGGSLRFDSLSRARLQSSRSIVLERGALYYDSEDDGRGIVVFTPLGEVTDIGTRFEVRLRGDAGQSPQLLVRVREGEVAARTEEGEIRLRGGTELVLGADGTEHLGTVKPHAPEWRWAVEVASVPPIEGANLKWFLDWVSREMGVTWSAAEPRPELEPEATILHGSVEGLTPGEALELVLAGAGLRQEQVDGELRISARHD